MNTMHLELCGPLVYGKYKDPAPQWFCQEGGGNTGADAEGSSGDEQIFCYELDTLQGMSIEPERGNFLGRLIFSGHAPLRDSNGLSPADSGSDFVTLPAGVYLFTQQREALGMDACIDMAMEQQKDGLWEKNILRNLLYVRFLYEDDKYVTQIFRPIGH